MSLDERRTLAADRAFEDADFGEAEVAAHNGWEVAGDSWRKTVFLDVGGPETARMVFGLEFVPGGDSLAHAPEYELPPMEDAHPEA